MNGFSEGNFLSAPPWLMAESQNSDVIIMAESSALRNVAGYSFCLTMKGEEKEQVKDILKSSLQNTFDHKMPMVHFSQIERIMLAERWIIPPKMAQYPGISEIFANNDESESAIVCGLEHLWIKVSSNIENLRVKTQMLQQTLDVMEPESGWAIHPQIGYLSSNPAYCGAGIIFSVVCHIPASVITNKFPEITSLADDYGIQLGDPWIGAFNVGNALVKLTTRALVGNNPDNLLASISIVAENVVEIERQARKKLMENRTILEDKVMRALGVVAYAKFIELWEFINIISTLRLGAALEIIPISIKKIDEILIMGQQAHISIAMDGKPTPMEAAVERARMMREKLGIDEGSF